MRNCRIYLSMPNVVIRAKYSYPCNMYTNGIYVKQCKTYSTKKTWVKARDMFRKGGTNKIQTCEKQQQHDSKIKSQNDFISTNNQQVNNSLKKHNGWLSSTNQCL